MLRRHRIEKLALCSLLLPAGHTCTTRSGKICLPPSLNYLPLSFDSFDLKVSIEINMCIMTLTFVTAHNNAESPE
jgi:hypothetical protein